ncbi:efflux RND transporter periplasmic adaptor subunit [Bordetella petrii]|uniref:efflux RND transporter periplasmic adaptor subunit n=1 Tax=Bordetella petrii TaxID=94624 RepID=UPI001A95E5AE|nr:efflux RND transporter periplasmic adaptor subunit [Bordetella petrii]MBO1112811.1 efflux RND transporter periplasmic adaptor subunit [Bordetella petrii]
MTVRIARIFVAQAALASAICCLPAWAQTDPLAAVSDPNAIRVLLTANPESTLAAPMAGRLDVMDARLGKHVEEGDVLFRLECAEPQARLRMAAAELAGAKETLRAKVGLRKLDAAGDTEVALARAATDRAAAAQELAQAQVDYCTVAAPYSGRVAKLYVRPHESVSVGTPLADLVSDGPVKLRLNLPSRELRHVEVGTPFQIDVIETGKRYSAVVTAINARVDAVAQSIELEGKAEDPQQELMPGMSGIADFQLSK